MGRGIPFGEYRLLRRLGAGGMAEVFLAKRDGPGGFEKQLVIKRILPHLSASDRFTSLFLREARLAALVDHPNLVHVSSFGEIDGEYYLAMEYVDGLTLADLLERTATLTPGVAGRIVVDVLDALHAIHEARGNEGEPLHLVHRDVSPRNVMITKAGAVKLLDFGIAVSAEEESLITMGTRRYMAPEHMLGESIDRRADLFSAGVVLFETLTGHVPFKGIPDRLPEQPPLIPDELWSVLHEALGLMADGRPRDARAMQRPIELFLSTRGIEGTRAHLGEVVGALAPSNTTGAGVLSRLTQFGQRTRLTRTGEIVVDRRLIWFGVALLVGGAVTWFALDRTTVDTGPVEVEPIATVELPPPKTSTVGNVELVAPPPLVTKTKPKRRPKKRSVKKSGRLTIDTTPWTVVYLGKKKLGMTPLQGVRLPSGKHKLRLTNPDSGLSETIVVTIRPGRVTRVRRTL